VNAPSVAVVGSANRDIVVRTARIAGVGETVLGGDLGEHAGGKGLNQSLAAARVAPTAFVGALGTDRAGETLAGALRAAGVDLSQVKSVPAGSGTAIVTVAADGDNSITVVPGANDDVIPEDVRAALAVLQPTVVVAQLEIPVASVTAAASWAEANGSRFVLNPSPLDRLDGLAWPQRDAMLAVADPLIVNAPEARGLLASTDRDIPLSDAARRLAELARSVIITDGPRGAWICEGDDPFHIPSLAVDAVDTTGAGDCFAGTVAALLARSVALAAAVAEASAAAGTLVTVPRGLR
jgi:ribokinase